MSQALTFEPVIQTDSPVERGGSSMEKAAQEDREQSSLAAVYVSPSQIPETPTEPPGGVVEDASATRQMRLGDELQVMSNYGNPSANIADLLGQMAGSVSQQASMLTEDQLALQLLPQPNKQVDSGSLLSLLSNEQVNQLLQQLNSVGQQTTEQMSIESTWNQVQPAVFQNGGEDGEPVSRRQGDIDNGWADRGRGRGRGRGFGRGRGKRRPCAFFAEGR